MMRFLLLAALVLVASVGTLSAGVSRRVDTTLTLSDGVRLSVVYFVPTAPRPAGGYPGLLLVHGFGGSKDDYAGLYAPLYADSGYFSVAYSVRGQGAGASASGGEFTWFTGDREIADCREVVAWMRSRPELNRERIGIEGISQGGLTAWGAAIAKLDLRCAVPIIAVPHYVRSFSSDGCVNGAFQTLLLLARNFNLIRLAPFLRDTLIGALEQDRFDDLAALIRPRDLEGREEEITIPIFVQAAWQDEIFSPREIMRAFASLRTPSKLMLWPGGHTLAGAYEAERLASTFRFYRHWLRDDAGGTIMSADSAVLLIDPANGDHEWLRVADSARWLVSPSLPADRLHLTARGRLSRDLPDGSFAVERIYLQNLSNEMIIYRSEPFGAGQRIIGARASLPIGSSARKFQANILLYDFDSSANTRRPITRGCFGVRRLAGEENERERIGIELAPQLYTLAPGHQLEVCIKFGSPAPPITRPAEEFGRTPWPPQESSRDTLFGSTADPAWIELIRYLPPEPAAVTMPAGHPESIDLEVVMVDDAIELAIRLEGGEVVEIELLDLTGRLLRQTRTTAHEGENRIGIPTGDLPAGAYLLHVATGTRSRVVKIIVR